MWSLQSIFMQAAYENRNMEILTDYETRKVVILKDLIPNWYGEKRYNNLEHVVLTTCFLFVKK